MIDTDLIHYLDDVDRLETIQAYKRETLALLEVKPGDCILDVGCGDGVDTLALAGLLGPTGRVVGLDISVTMATEARRRAQGSRHSPDYLVANVYQLCFHDGTFDGCRADRVLHTLRDPRQALSEMVRVARPGARLVVHEPDWGTLAIDAPYPILTRRILNHLCDSVPNGWMGRQLPRLFQELNLSDITVTVVSGTLHDFKLARQLLHLDTAVTNAIQAGVVDWAEGFGWLQALKQRSQEGGFFSVMSGVTVCGQRT